MVSGILILTIVVMVNLSGLITELITHGQGKFIQEIR